MEPPPLYQIILEKKIKIKIQIISAYINNFKKLKSFSKKNENIKKNNKKDNI